MHARFTLLFAILVASVAVTAQQPAQPPATDTTAPAIAGVVAAGARVQVIKEGFSGTEGPIAHPDGSVIFTETQANRITRIDAQDNVTTFLENSSGSNGLARDAKGRLVSVQTAPPTATKVGIIYPPSAAATLAEGFGGRPNDLVMGQDGQIYFTVPSYMVGAQAPTPPAGWVPSIYSIAPGRSHVKVADGIAFPNGLTLSRDERLLFVNDTQGEYLIVFDVRSDGTLTNKRPFARYEGVTRNPDGGAVNSGADGLAIDGEGRLYAATTPGVQVFDSMGRHLGTIPTSRPAQNLAFAGADKRTLYIVGRGAAWKVPMLAQGFKGRAK